MLPRDLESSASVAEKFLPPPHLHPPFWNVWEDKRTVAAEGMKREERSLSCLLCGGSLISCWEEKQSLKQWLWEKWGRWGAKGKASGCLPYRGNIMEKPALVGLEPLRRSLTNFALDSSQASGFWKIACQLFKMQSLGAPWEIWV